MSLPKYESYKDSGVEWLGEVPKHWEVKRVKNVANINMGQSPSSQDCNQDGNGTPFLQGNADFGETNPFPRHFCSVANKLSSTGDILFSVRAPVGAINISDQIYGIGRGLCAFTPNKFNFVKFFFFALEIVKSELFSVATGSTYEAVSVEQIANAIFIAPPIIEQNAIAQFLDKETTKIDNLIAEQQQLIKLLKEKRQAVISHAVTKGLNPDVPMKDSGVEWLGEVPEHWSLVPLKVLISKIESGKSVNAIDVPAEANEIGVLKTSCVYGGKFNPSENKTVIDAEINLVSCPLKEGMLIVSRMNTPELVGATGYVSNAPDNIYLPDRLWQIHFDKTNEKFIYFWTLSCFYRAYIKSVCTGTSSSMQNLSQEQFKSFLLVVPNEIEQATIARFLDQETAKIDNLIAESTNLISLSKERRSALISSAVTGKIDVRNYVPSQSQVEAMA